MPGRGRGRGPGPGYSIIIPDIVLLYLAQDDHLHPGHLHPGGPGPDLGRAGEDGPGLSLPEHKVIQLDDSCDSLYDSLYDSFVAAYLSTKSFSLRNQSFVKTSLRASNHDGPMSVERICKSLDIFVS